MEKNSVASLLTSVDSLFTTQEERDIASQPRVQEIPIDMIDDFPNHPFKVRMDDNMIEMAESVKQHGILVPAIVRPKENGHHEMVAGHRRKLACTLIAKLQLPCIVRELTDEEATIIMVDSNLQREQLLPSEKAFAYKMKLDAMKRQGARTDLTSDQLGPMLSGVRTNQVLAEQVSDSKTQVQRYIRLTNLIPPLMEAVDAGKLKFVPAADYISHLTEKEQTYLQFLMERDEVSPSVDQAQRLKQISAEGKLENNIIDLIMREEKPLERKVTLRNDRLQKYFPASYTPKQMEEVIIKLLEGWHRRRQQEQTR